MTCLLVARLGVELGSDLGVITAISQRQGDTLSVEYAMNFIDANNPQFLSRLEMFPGPRNHADLRLDSELVVPDLRHRVFSIQL